MQPTILDIAREANVSKTVVSDILRGSGSSRFHEDTRQRVLDTAHALGYTPNRAARSLVTGRTNLIALWMPHLLSSYYARIAHIVETQLRATPYDLLIAHVDNAPPSQVDGVIALVDSENSLERGRTAFKRLKSRGRLPALCLIGCNVDESKLKEADAVSVDLCGATKKAVAHLIGTGCERIAFLTGDAWYYMDEVRYATYTAAMRAAGRTPEYIGVATSVFEPRASAHAALLEYSRNAALPDGILCLNDELAIGALRGLREIGLRVPSDVAVIGCDGIEDTQYVAPELSTMVQPIAEMCERAWELLQQRIETPGAAPQQINLKAELVIRASSQRREVQSKN